MKPQISIITRTRDRSVLLRRAAESVIGQGGSIHWQWIIVNDAGDPEEVEAIVQPFHRRCPAGCSIEVLHLPTSLGMEHASNRGVERAFAPLVVIHDDDDSWLPDFLARMVGWLEAPGHEDFAGVVCHSIRIEEAIDGDSVRTLAEQPFNPWLQALTLWRLLEENCYPPISFVFRRAAYLAVGGYDESLPVLGDWEFNLRLLLQRPIGVLPQALARYHHRPPQQVGAMANSITAGHDRHRHFEQVLRHRWLKQAPADALPAFGRLSRVAGIALEQCRALDRLLSLPIQPGLKV